MPGLGTIINCAAIVIGGVLGAVFGHFLNERVQGGLKSACGIGSMFIGLSGAIAGMLSYENGSFSSTNAMLVVGSLALGTLVGELIDIDSLFTRFGQWLKLKSGNAKDANFVNGFVTASLTVSIGAMAIVGSIQDGIMGDYSVLATKAVLDLIIVMVMTSAMGKGAIFSAIPVGVFQGSMTALSRLLMPVMTDEALSNLSTVGSVLIFCVGLNLIWEGKIRVANMLPAILVSVIWAFF